MCSADNAPAVAVTVSFFSGEHRRELRPGRLQTVGPSTQSVDKWRKLREVAAAEAAMVALKGQARARRGSEAALKPRGGANAAYWKQGDVDLHARELWEQRMDLSTSPIVAEELHGFWQMLRASFGKGPETPFEGLTESMYSKLQLRFYKALISPFDPVDARLCARDDWRSDSKGASLISRIALNEALFETADVWTRTVRAEAYALFLRLLFDQITMGEPPTLKPLSAIAHMDLSYATASRSDGRGDCVTPSDGPRFALLCTGTRRSG